VPRITRSPSPRSARRPRSRPSSRSAGRLTEPGLWPTLTRPHNSTAVVAPLMRLDGRCPGRAPVLESAGGSLPVPAAGRCPACACFPDRAAALGPAPAGARSVPGRHSRRPRTAGANSAPSCDDGQDDVGCLRCCSPPTVHHPCRSVPSRTRAVVPLPRHSFIPRPAQIFGPPNPEPARSDRREYMFSIVYRSSSVAWRSPPPSAGPVRGPDSTLVYHSRLLRHHSPWLVLAAFAEEFHGTRCRLFHGVRSESSARLRLFPPICLRRDPLLSSMILYQA